MKDTKTNFITAYAAFLTSNFSRDQEGVLDYTENYRRVEMPFEKTVTKDIPSFERLCDTAAENGMVAPVMAANIRHRHATTIMCSA